MKKNPAVSVGLALRRIADNLTYTPGSVTAWYVVPSVQWPFRLEGDRRASATAFALALAPLAGHRIHVRVTSQPHGVADWARHLNADTPNPLPGPVPGGAGWVDHLVTLQRHLHQGTMLRKRIYLGVVLPDRRRFEALVAAVRHTSTAAEQRRISEAVTRITAALDVPGFHARPATTGDVEWLIRRSIGIGLPAPSRLCASADPVWEHEDLVTFVDGIDVHSRPFSGMSTVTGTIAGRTTTRHVAVVTFGRMDEIEFPHPTRMPWLADMDRLGIDYELSSHCLVLDPDQVRPDVRRATDRITAQIDHYENDHGLVAPPDLRRKQDTSREIEAQMYEGTDLDAVRVHGWHRVAVYAPTAEGCQSAVDKLIESYRGLRVSIEHPTGPHHGVTQAGLLREFIPGERVSTVAYKRRLPLLFFTAGVPAATSTVGDQRGPYIGFTYSGSRQPVMHDPYYPMEHLNRSGLVPIVGIPGSGKSVLQAVFIYQNALRGICTTVLDPSGPMAALTRLPELRGHSRHVSLTDSPAGTLNPYRLIADPDPTPTEEELQAVHAVYGYTGNPYTDPAGAAENVREALRRAAQDEREAAEGMRRELAGDILRALLPWQDVIHDETPHTLATAVRTVGGGRDGSLDEVLDVLAGLGSHGARLYESLRDVSGSRQARLFFAAGGDGHTFDEDVLVVLTLNGLELPRPGVPREAWTSVHRVAVPVLRAATLYASRRVYERPRSERKMVVLDEVGQTADWDLGRHFFTRLGVDSRKFNAAVILGSQDPSHILGMDIANYVSASYLGRIEDHQIASEALRFAKIPTDSGYEATLASLSATPADGAAPEFREFLFTDPLGRSDVIAVDVSWNPALLAAVNTTPGARHSQTLTTPVTSRRDVA